MPALTPADYNDLLAMTRENLDDAALVDNIMTRRPSLDLLKDKIKSGSGHQFHVNLEIGEDGRTDVSDSTGAFPTTKSSDIATRAVYDWSLPITSSIRLDHVDLEKNAGSPEQLVDLAVSHLNAAKKNHGKKLVALLHGDATAPVAGSFESFDRVIGNAAFDADPKGDASGDEAFNLGGIDSSTADYWQATRRTLGTSTEPSIRKAFRTICTDIYLETDSDNMVDYILTGRDVYDEYVDTFDDKIRYVLDGKESQQGQTKFGEVWFGDVKVRLDPDMPVDRAYFLDTSVWKIKHLNDNFFKMHETQFISGTLEHVTPLSSIIGVGVTERRANGMLIRDGS